MGGILPMGNFYQFGYLASDIDAAERSLGELYGITKVRRKRASEWMETLHAWTGDTMVEVIVCGPGAPSIYTNQPLPVAGNLMLHHLGRRILDEGTWHQMEQAARQRGLCTEMMGSVMNGQLRYAYVDTRAMLGVYTEYVMLSGDALHIYDDVPQNDLQVS